MNILKPNPQIDARILQLEFLTKLLEGVQHFERKAENNRGYAAGASGGFFPNLATKWEGTADTCDRAASRLRSRYNYEIENLKKF